MQPCCRGGAGARRPMRTRTSVQFIVLQRSAAQPGGAAGASPLPLLAALLAALRLAYAQHSAGEQGAPVKRRQTATGQAMQRSSCVKHSLSFCDSKSGSPKKCDQLGWPRHSVDSVPPCRRHACNARGTAKWPAPERRPPQDKQFSWKHPPAPTVLAAPCTVRATTPAELRSQDDIHENTRNRSIEP